MAATADVVIIGGGVMGTSLAYHLARRNVGHICLLEKQFLGAGSSGKSGAIIRQHYSHRLTVQMARRGLQFFQQFPDLVGGPAVFTHTGLAIVVPAASRPALQANVAMQQELGVDVRLISAEELREIDPNVHAASDEAIAYESEAGYVEAMQVVGGFADAAQRHRAEVRLETEVTRILLERSRVAGVETRDGRWETRTVVIAAGPWAAAVARSVGLPLPVTPCRTQVALFRRPADDTAHLSVYGDFLHEVYFRPTAGEMVHVGSISPREAEDLVDPDHYRQLPDEHFVHECRRKLSHRVPVMRRGPGRGGFAALYSITPDWHPILDRVSEVEGLYCAVGFSGHGFKLSPVVGELMTELIVDGSATTLDIRPLSLKRFQKGELITSPYEYGVMG